TGGEPTRVILEAPFDLGSGSLAERREIFAAKYDYYRSAFCTEPRASDTTVGALLVPPSDPTCSVGVIYFNNTGYLNMCGHGTIGLVRTLEYLGRLQPGSHRIDTPVGAVGATLHPDGRVSVENVASYRAAKGFVLPVEGLGKVAGDIAWGGNWFFLIENHGLEITLKNREQLTDYCLRVKDSLALRPVRQAQGEPETQKIDHIELFGPSQIADSRNFVLCPGGAYDRSPCGTGTSAKLACLSADGKLSPGQVWRQESVIGTVFEAAYRLDGGGSIIPTITGSAFVNAKGDIVLDEKDPFQFGIS
ncbi:MAG TPA: proline racemase family protein, partial [Chthoniobacterales bacterium]